jgi:hypothetical protein
VGLEVTFKHGAKSFEIIKWLFDVLDLDDVFVLDLTYGVGRFYRMVRGRVWLLIGVDIVRYEWEVEPDVFYQVDARWFASLYDPPRRPDLIVVDPPWSHEKRGVKAMYTGISNQPYHMRGVDSTDLVLAALRLARRLGSRLLYRYKDRLDCNHEAHVTAEVKMIRNKGYVHYGVCS